MKKLFFGLVIVFCTLLTACNFYDPNHYAESSIHDITSNNVNHSESLPDEIINSDLDEPNTQTEARLDIQLNEAECFITEAQLLDVSPLYFTEILGSRKSYPYSLPEIIGFKYPYVFYERMSVIVQDANADDAELYIGRYSLETKEKQELPIDRFLAISDEARLVVDCDHVVYMYFTTDENGKQVMNTELFNFEDSTKKILSTNRAHNVFGYTKKLTAEKLVFFLYESTGTGTQQIILLYDFDTESIKEIYRGENMSGYRDSGTSTKDIFAIDTYAGDIYLLMQQYVNGCMKFFIRTIDMNGVILWEEELDDLSSYDSLEDTAESLVVKGDYVFIHFSQYNKGPENSNSPSAFFYKSTEGYKLLELKGSNIPKTVCGIGEDEVPYIFFHIHDSADEILVVNTGSGERFAIKLIGDGIANKMVDSSGNMLIESRDEDISKWYLIRTEEVIDMLK